MVLGMDSESELVARVFEPLAKLIENSELGFPLLMRRPRELAEALELLVELFFPRRRPPPAVLTW